MNISNALKLTQCDIDVRGLTAIRKHTHLPYQEIQRRVSAGEYIIEAEGADDAALTEILSLYKELVALGYTPELFEGNYPVTEQFFQNVLQSREEIRHEIESDDYPD